MRDESSENIMPSCIHCGLTKGVIYLETLGEAWSKQSLDGQTKTSPQDLQSVCAIYPKIQHTIFTGKDNFTGGQTTHSL